MEHIVAAGVLSFVESASRWLVGALLILTALTKLFNLRWFAGVLSKYGLVPSGAINIAASAVPLLELSIGVVLLLGLGLPAWSYAAMVLFLVFTGAIAINLAKGKFDVECGCNSFWKKTKIGWHLVFRNLGLCGLAFISSGVKALAVGEVYVLVFLASLILIIIPYLPKWFRHKKLRPGLERREAH